MEANTPHSSSPTPPPPGSPVPRDLRHDLRGRINGLKLCAAALDSNCTREESLEFLGDIISLCDKVCTLLDQFDALPNLH